MAKEQTTKYFSNRQESRIADYLDWSVVSGSGARSFHPGDIKSEEFLGECKTHMTLSDTIFIYVDVWSKIINEAASVFRKPVLFVDNGSQIIENTWCIVPKVIIPTTANVTSIEHSFPNMIKQSKTRTTFNHLNMKLLFAQQNNDIEHYVYNISLCESELCIMTLSSFRNIFIEGV